jgi:hypothetical protein
MKEYANLNELLADLTPQLAEMRGESLAARLLATAGLDWLLSRTPVPDHSLANISKMLDGAFDHLRERGGDESLNQRMIEVAQARCDEILSEIKRIRKF